MATVTEAVRRLTIEATSRGVREVAADLLKVSAGQEAIAITGQKAERATQSLEGRFASIQKRYDATFRAQQDMARVDRDLMAAQAQGLVSQERRLELLSLAAERHGLATAAINRETAATQQLASAQRMQAAANDNQWRRRNLTFQLFDIGQMAALGQNPMLTALQQGPQVLQLYAGQGGVKAALADTASVARGLGSSLGAVGGIAAGAAAVAGVALLGLQHEINATSKVAVGFGDVFQAVFQLAGDAIMTQLKPAIEMIAPWFQSAWDIVVQGVKAAGNAFIAGWVIQIDAVKTAVGALPDVFIVAGEAAANGFLKAIKLMIQNVITAFNVLVIELRNKLKDAGFDTLAGIADGMTLNNSVKGIRPIDIGGAAAAGRLSSTWEGFKDQASATWNQDFMGDAFDAIEAQAIKNELADIAAAADKAGGSLKKAAEDAKDPWEGLRRTTNRINEGFVTFRDTVSGAFEGIGSTITQALQGGASGWEAFQQAGLRALDSITSKLADMATNQLLDLALNYLGNTLFFRPTPNGFNNMLRNANGNVFSGPGISAYSNSIVDRPTIFPFAKGVGLMGEEGEEAIMPLRRDSHGRLGVAANQNGGTNIKFEVIDRRTNGGTVEQQQSTGPNGEIVLRAIVRDEMKKGMKPTLQAGFGITPKVSRRS